VRVLSDSWPTIGSQKASTKMETAIAALTQVAGRPTS
jgi:hypothetical protein